MNRLIILFICCFCNTILFAQQNIKLTGKWLDKYILGDINMYNESFEFTGKDSFYYYNGNTNTAGKGVYTLSNSKLCFYFENKLGKPYEYIEPFSIKKRLTNNVHYDYDINIDAKFHSEYQNLYNVLVLIKSSKEDTLALTITPLKKSITIKKESFPIKVVCSNVGYSPILIDIKEPNSYNITFYYDKIENSDTLKKITNGEYRCYDFIANDETSFILKRIEPYRINNPVKFFKANL